MKTQGVGFKGNAKKASEAWAGDRYTAWEEKASGEVPIVWTSVWDTAEDATQFFATYIHPNLPPGITPKRTLLQLPRLVQAG